MPAGSVAVANGHAAVYPTASPGGWHLVGRTGFPLFRADRPPYAVLAPGDRVRFTVAGVDEVAEPGAVRPPSWSVPPDARAVLEILAPGLRTSVQDAGRRGVAAVGVPDAGPADPVSFDLANRLVGHARAAGTLELTGGGTRLRCLTPCHVAVVGALPEVSVGGTPERDGQLLPLAPGQVLEVGRLRGGCRSYVAVAGGFLGPVWFGSTASDELTGLGAGPLASGAVLHAGAWAPPLGDHLVAGSATALDAAAPVELRVLPGPHAEQFATDAIAQLAAAVFEVQPASNRVGIRLRAESAPVALRDAPAGERSTRMAWSPGPCRCRPMVTRWSSCPTTPRSAATPCWRWWPRPTMRGWANARPARACASCRSISLPRMRHGGRRVGKWQGP